MDPVRMINLIRRDVASRRWVAVLLAALTVVGTVGWLPALSARGSISRIPSERSTISVLPDPFGGQDQ